MLTIAAFVVLIATILFAHSLERAAGWSIETPFRRALYLTGVVSSVGIIGAAFTAMFYFAI